MEILGTLANLTPLDLPVGVTWGDLLHKYPQLLPICRDIVCQVTTKHEADLVLEIILFWQALALDVSAAEQLIMEGCVPCFHQVWLAHQHHNTEVVLQVLHGLHRLLHHPAPRTVICANQQMVEDIAAAVRDTNASIRQVAVACTALVMETDRWDEGVLGGQLLLTACQLYDR